MPVQHRSRIIHVSPLVDLTHLKRSSMFTARAVQIRGFSASCAWPTAAEGDSPASRKSIPAKPLALSPPRTRFAVRLVDPNLDQTGGGDIVVMVANLVGSPQTSRWLLVVIAKLAYHLLWAYGFLIVVLQLLVLRNIADRTDRCPADLAGALGNCVGHGEDLRRLLVEQQVVIAKMAAAHVAVKILRLHIKREEVCKQLTQVVVISSTAFPLRSVGIAVLSFVAIVLFSFQLQS